MKHIITIAALLLCATHTHAGQAIDIRVLDRTVAKPATYRTRLLLGENAFSLDTTAFQGRPSTMLCRRNEAVYVLNRQNKRYVAVNMQTLTGASSVVRGASELLSEGWSAMTGTPSTGGPITVEATGTRRSIGGIPCEQHHVLRGGTRIQELWTTDWRNVKAPSNTLDLVKTVAASWSGVAPLLSAGGDAPSIPLDALLKITGYPVLFTQYDGARTLYEARFSLPTATTIKPADLAVPAGYTRSLTP